LTDLGSCWNERKTITQTQGKSPEQKPRNAILYLEAADEDVAIELLAVAKTGSCQRQPVDQDARENGHGHAEHAAHIHGLPSPSGADRSESVQRESEKQCVFHEL